MQEMKPSAVLDRFRRAKEGRSVWEAHWQECYDYALPQRGDLNNMQGTGGEKRTDRLFDGTAPDAVDQLAASLLGHLTPPWAQWFGFAFGPGTAPEDRRDLASELDRMASVMQAHFDRSNFAVEMHQCYLDLVTVGTACLLFEEAPAGEPSAFRFTAVPLSQIVLDDSGAGRLDIAYRRVELNGSQFRNRFGKAELPFETKRRLDDDPEAKVAVIEAVVPAAQGIDYLAVLEEETGPGNEPVVLARGRFAQSPFIAFRWQKAPGESYGRSPVMKALPDIKTANKVVELVLKNASIAVTGIWQADDDGVLNPATIKLAPGTIIPKAVGSAGLTPLDAPGKFDISQIVLADLRERIRQAMLADKLGQVNGPRMTATEVLERAADMARLLGATYGRLQSELLTPLVTRAQAILRRRGEVANLRIDGHLVELRYKSPLARDQSREEAQNISRWLESLAVLGPTAMATVDVPAAARWLGKAFAVPEELILDGPVPGTDPAGGLAGLAGLAGGPGGAPPAMPTGGQMPDMSGLAGLVGNLLGGAAAGPTGEAGDAA